MERERASNLRTVKGHFCRITLFDSMSLNSQ